jgi:ribonuclease E
MPLNGGGLLSRLFGWFRTEPGSAPPPQANARAARESPAPAHAARSETRERSRERGNRGRDNAPRQSQRPTRQSASQQPQQNKPRQEQRNPQRAERKPAAPSAGPATEPKPQQAVAAGSKPAADKATVETPRIAPVPTPAPAQEHKVEIETPHKTESAQTAPDQKAVNADGTPAKRRRGRRGGRRRKRASEVQTTQGQGKIENASPSRDVDDDEGEPSRASAPRAHARERMPTPSQPPMTTTEHAEHPASGSLSAHSRFASDMPTAASGAADVHGFPAAAAPHPTQDSPIETAPVAAKLPTPEPFAAGERAPAGNSDAAAPLPSPSEGASEAALTPHRPALGTGGGMGSSQGGFNAPGAPSTPQSAFAPHQGDLLPKPATPKPEPAPMDSGSETSSGSN